MFGEEWRPDRSGMVIAFDNTGERLLCRVYVHPKKQRWREPQFRPMLGRIAETGLVGKRNYHTLVCIGDRIILLLPDDEIEITGKAYAVRQENGQWRGYTFPTAEQARQFALAS